MPRAETDVSLMGPPPSDELELRRVVREAEALLFGVPVEPVRVGRFEIERHVGSGGLGVVYAARDPQLDRVVALKVLRGDASGADDELGERLLAEARAMARLSHDHVVTVYEAGADRGRVFLAMELIDGVTLRARLATPTSWRETLAVLVQAGRGLAAAHAAGLAHRDFKPENVLVDREGRARVTDFGLACAVDETGAWTRAAGGTPPYMAPEQHDGAPADPATDQYAFAVTAVEALTGRRPLEGESLNALIDAKRAGYRAQLTRSVPPRIRVALERALAPEPSDRWPSMDALLAELTRAPRRTLGRTLAYAAIAVFLLAVLTGAILQFVMFTDYRDAATAPTVSGDAGASR